MPKSETTTKLQDELSKQYSSAQNAITTVRALWSDRELLAFTKLANADQSNRKSRISLGDLATIVMERTGRTVAQLPTGKVRPASKMDEKNCRLIELALSRYVIPNANDQFPTQLKLFLVDYLSDIYGGIDVLSYWRIDDEYIGPDWQILSPRSVFWEAGKQNKRSASYVFVSTYVSKEWLESKQDLPNWDKKVIGEVLAEIKQRGSAKPSAREDSNRRTSTDTQRNSTSEWGDTAEIELVTKYERGKKGKWISFLPDFENKIVRNIKNPDESGRLPVISKESQMPMIDSVYGQGAVERGESLQKTLDSITNLTHDGLKYSIYPVTKYNGTMVQRSTLKWQPGAFWNLKDMNAIATHEVGGQALNTFLPVQQFLTSKMLNQNGTTSTQISESDKISGYGKTPEALKAQASRESTMDRVSRDRLETFWGDLIEHWIGMLTTKQEKPIEFYIYDEEINLLGTEDVEMNDGARYAVSESGLPEKERKVVLGSAKVTIEKGKLAGKYKYIVDTSSSMLKDESEEHDKLTEILTTVLKLGPDQINAMLAQEGSSISLAGLIKRWVISGGTKDWDAIIKDMPKQPMQQPQMDMQSQMAPQMTPQMPQPQMQPQMPPQMGPPMQQPMGQPMGQPMQGFSDYQPDPQTLEIVKQIQKGGF